MLLTDKPLQNIVEANITHKGKPLWSGLSGPTKTAPPSGEGIGRGERTWYSTPPFFPPHA